MSREIKFRAWHKNANYMCQSVETNFLYKDYLEFMQYTGLNDKTKWEELTEKEQKEWKRVNEDKTQEDWIGKEICTGDICKDDTGTILEIVWVEDKFQFGAKVLKGCTLSKGLTFPLWQWNCCKENGFRQLQVIGNIYENPNVLKED